MRLGPLSLPHSTRHSTASTARPLPGHLSSPSPPPHAFFFALLLAEPAAPSSGSNPRWDAATLYRRERSSSIGPLVETLAQADLQAESPKSRRKEGRMTLLPISFDRVRTFFPSFFPSFNNGGAKRSWFGKCHRIDWKWFFKLYFWLKDSWKRLSKLHCVWKGEKFVGWRSFVFFELHLYLYGEVIWKNCNWLVIFFITYRTRENSSKLIWRVGRWRLDLLNYTLTLFKKKFEYFLESSASSKHHRSSSTRFLDNGEEKPFQRRSRPTATSFFLRGIFVYTWHGEVVRV